MACCLLLSFPSQMLVDTSIINRNGRSGGGEDRPLLKVKHTGALKRWTLTCFKVTCVSEIQTSDCVSNILVQCSLNVVWLLHTIR